MTPSRLLTLPQPFASALVSGARLVHCADLRQKPDLRAELPRLRGETLIVRAADVNWAALPKARRHLDLPPVEDLPERAALGTVVLDGVAATSDSPWWKPEHTVLVFRNPVALPAPLPWDGDWTRHWSSLLLHLRRDVQVAVEHAIREAVS
ncbi:hypothetical protein [Deinococcus wulumuqiensis]|uniref:hypothetical protein n=1 Tax=Deinococcus wulumuqiensis TaxID=980427 RepID=UPI00242F7F01|nr:hypothetical protein [Deinococcus wulumuqiensis]